MKEWHLYFIQQNDDGPIKIGITTNVASRLSSVQCGNPQKLNLLFSLPYPSKEHARADERYLHFLFEHLKISGEWFEPKPFLVERIEVIKHHGVDGMPEAQTSAEDRLTHYEVFTLIFNPISEIHKAISHIHQQILRIGRIQAQYKSHGDYQSCKYIMAELEDTMRDLRWRYHDEPNRKPFNG